jgi:predicted PurR-regulated permease PerM
MTKEKIQHNFLYSLFAIVGIIGLFILSPYFSVLFIAIMFAILFKPMHMRMESWMGGRKTISALVATIAVMLLVLVPVSLIGFQVFQESKQLYVAFADGTINMGPLNMVAQKYMPQVGAMFSADISQYIEKGLQWLLGNLSAWFSSVIGIVMGFFLMLFILFFLFRDGDLFKRMLVSLSPFDESHNKELLDQIESAIASVVKGSLMIAVLQGSLAGIGYMIVGVPSPVLWGVVSIFASLIPGIGTSLVIFPALIFLMLSGKVVATIILAIWGLVLVGGIDNLIRPTLVGKGAKLHPLIVLLSALGGIQLFGFIGFLIGPIVFSILAALMRIYPQIMKEHARDVVAN